MVAHRDSLHRSPSKRGPNSAQGPAVVCVDVDKSIPCVRVMDNKDNKCDVTPTHHRVCCYFCATPTCVANHNHQRVPCTCMLRLHLHLHLLLLTGALRLGVLLVRPHPDMWGKHPPQSIVLR